MSLAAAHESKRARHICQSCRDRKARFRYRDSVRADRDHSLCFECYRREQERQRAKRLAVLPASHTLMSSPTLSQRQVVHRQAMLAHMARQVTRTSPARMLREH